VNFKEIGYEIVNFFYMFLDRDQSVVGFCEHYNESVDLIKGRKFVSQLGAFYFLKKDSAPCSVLFLST
jgi:hypothetical protein